MKTLLTCLMVALMLPLMGQIASPVIIPQSEWHDFFKSKKLSFKTWDYAKTGTIVGISILQALPNAVNEAMYTDPDRAMNNWRILKHNQAWVDGRISWQNKYAGGIEANGERFPGSTTILVSTTDLHHFDRFQLTQLENIKTSLIFVMGQKPNWQEWLINTVAGNAARGLVTHFVIQALRK